MEGMVRTNHFDIVAQGLFFNPRQAKLVAQPPVF
jgi:hypothetical protein